MAIDWKDEIAKLCEQRGWSLRALARDLDTPVSYLSAVMNDKRPASLVLKIKLCSRLGYDKSSELLVELLPDDAAEAWAQWETKKTDLK